MLLLESGKLARSLPRSEPWQDVEGCTAEALVDASSVAPRFTLPRPGKAERLPLSSLSCARGGKTSATPGLPSTRHPNPSRHSCPSHAVSQRHRASEDVLPSLDLPRAPPRLDAACLPGTGDTASMPRVQAYDQAFSSSPPPAQPRLFNHTNTIPAPSPINGDAIATIL